MSEGETRRPDEADVKWGPRDAMMSFSRIWMMLSRLPLPKFMLPPEARMPDGRDMIVFPLAGALLALIATLAPRAAAEVLPPRACAWAATALYLAFGWSFHLDGWGDLWDGVGSGRRGEALRAVMKDSRVGSFAAAGIVVALALRSELLGALPPERWLAASCASAAVGRWAANLASWRGTYPWGKGGISDGIVNGTGPAECAAALGVSALTYPLAPELWLCAVPLSAAVGASLSAFSERAMGGTNGDVLGACSVLAEILSLGAACYWYA